MAASVVTGTDCVAKSCEYLDTVAGGVTGKSVGVLWRVVIIGVTNGLGAVGTTVSGPTMVFAHITFL